MSLTCSACQSLFRRLMYDQLPVIEEGPTDMKYMFP